MTSFKTYNLFLLALIFGFLAVVAIFSWVVDPYGIFKSGYFKVKPAIAQNTRLVKTYQVAEYGADTIILGSSRAEAGLDPELLAGRAYNLGIPGANVAELLAFLKHAQAAHPIKSLILQPDFFSFNAYQDAQAGFNPDIMLSVDMSGFERFLWHVKKYMLLVNIDHVLDAIETAGKKNPEKITVNLYRENGFHEPEQRIRRIRQVGGIAKAFEKGIARYKDEIWFPKGKGSFAFEQGGYYSFADYEATLRFAKEQGIKTRIVLAPVHSKHIKALRTAGLGPLWIEWKDKIRDINARVAGFTLEDYTNFQPYISETVPEEEGALMRWYLDNAHYNADLGRVILRGAK